MKVKSVFKAIIILVILGALAVFIYNRTTTRNSRELERAMIELSPRGGTPETIESLRQAIRLHEEQIERHVRDAARTGVYWRILGIRLADRNMHRDALDAFQRAIDFNTRDASSFYLAGISAAHVAKSIVGFSPDSESQREHYFRLAENAHLRALELDVTYTRPMYALGILYAFELNRPEDAIIQLERLLQIRPSDIDSLFVLARAYFMTEDFAAAIEVYDRIIARTRDQNVMREAQNLRDTVMGIRYE
ncbi:MAG: tetratricopeptide repeat protein [Treponema sp.]|nr:tetratricopeptide repeat protein [Treponema sp.]